MRVPIFDSEFYCPCCDGVVDVYGDHCLVCPCVPCSVGDSLGRASKIVIAKIDYTPLAELREPTKDELWYHKLNRARQTRWTRQCSSLPPDPNRK